MQKPNDWEKAQRQTQFGTVRLPADGYVCKIMSVQDTVSQTGKPMLKIALDIAEGEYAKHFWDRYNSRKKYNPDAKWPCIGIVMKTNDDGSTNGGFKNFVECVRESNGGWEPSWDDNFETKFKGAAVGCVFIEEEYEPEKFSVKPDFAHFKSVSDIREGKFDVPKPKLYAGSNNQAGQKPQGQSNYQDDDLPEGFQTIDESEIPF